MKKFIISFLFYMIFFLGISQEKTLFLLNENGIELKVDSINWVSENDFQYFLKQLKNKQINEGYFQFSIDSIQRSETKNTVYCFFGKKYLLGKIKMARNNQDSYAELIKNELQSVNDFNNLKNLLDPLSDNGYPFAELIVNQLKIEDSICNISIDIEPNQLVRIDSLVIKTEEKIENKLISRIINIYPGELYSEKKIQNIDQEIRKSLLYVLVKNTEVLFTDQGAQVYLYLKKKPSNIFDGIIGVQQKIDDNKISLNGALNFRLQNNFQRGELLVFDWKKLPSETQELAIQVSYPYIGFTNFGVKGDLSIYRQDSSFISTSKKAGLSYRLSLYEEIGVFLHNNNSFDQKNIDEASNNSSSYKAAGVWFFKNNFDSQINPKKGFSFYLSYSAGNRNEQSENSQLEIQHRSEVEIKKALPIYKGINVLFKVKEKFQSLGSQLENEMILFGGNNTLRGFDELSIQATSMISASLNLRYFLDQNTNIYLFYDQSWYERNGKNEYVADQPYGLGAGFSFMTNTGMFSFNYALGSQFKNPLNIRTGKIHFGLISQF